MRASVVVAVVWQRLILVLLLLSSTSLRVTLAFSSTTTSFVTKIMTQPSINRVVVDSSCGGRPSAFVRSTPCNDSDSVVLFMSDKGGGDESRERSTKKGLKTITIEKTATKADVKKEEQWRVVLHNDEVHTFNYVIQSLCKVIGTLDRKRAFDICVLTHGTGKATITKSWKAQAEKYCLGLQRQGLTASIAPDSKFQGGSDNNKDKDE